VAAAPGLELLGKKEDAWRGKMSLRWVLNHMIEEYARHNGHADLLREAIDGATMYELMARREGWDTTAWA